jgi:hypothetical protein
MSDETVRVVVSRYWNKPQITVTVNHEKIELFTDIGVFREALLTELGSPWRLFTRERLRRKMEQAFTDIIEKVKEASAQVM